MFEEDSAVPDVNRRTLMKLAGTAGAAGLAGCTNLTGDGNGGGNDGELQMGGELVATYGADVKNFDPTKANDTTSTKAFDLVYETLVGVDFEGKPKPYLAKSVTQDSDTEFTINLREGVKFHNEDELTAQDVRSTFRRYEGTPRESDVYNWYESSTVEGDYTLKLTLSRKYAPIRFALANVPIVPKAVADGDIKLKDNPVGTGPYKFDQHQPDELFRLVRNENHWFGGKDDMPDKPPIKTLTFRIITEQSAQAAALESGDVDFIGTPPAGKIQQYKQSDKFQVDERIAGGFDMFVYPMHPEANTPFQNRKVRLGTNRLIPREQIVETVYDGIGRPAYAPISPLAAQFTSQEFQNEMKEQYSGYDTEKATQLLAEGFEAAGFEKPFKTKIITNENPQRVQWCQLIQESMNQTEFFDVELNQFEFNTYVSKILGENSHTQNQIVAVGWSAGWDPDNYVHNLFHKEQFTPACCNINHYSRQKINDLIDQGLATYDIEERKSIYEELQRELVKDSPMAYIRFGMRQDAWRKNRVSNFETYPIDGSEYAGVYAPYAGKYTWVTKGQNENNSGGS